MNNLIADLGRNLESLSSPAGFWQIGILLVGFGAAWLLARAARSRVSSGIEPGRWKVAAGGFNRVAFPILALAFVWLGYVVVSKFHDAPVLKIALPLLASYSAIRMVVYLLRHLIPPSPFLKVSERAIAYSAWGLAALYLTGLLPEVVTTLSEFGFTAGKQRITLLMVLTGILTVFITLLIAVTISRVAQERVMRADTVNLSLRLVVTKLIHGFAVFMAVVIALPLVGIDITVLSVFGGALGVGLGFGLQKVASNYVSGFIILLERSIRLGDLVTVDNRHGIVTSIKGRYTVIKSLDGTESLLPNETLIISTVVNHSYTDPVTSLKLPITVSYDADLDRVTELLLETAAGIPRILKGPAPAILVKNLGDNGIELEFVVWIRDADQGLATLRSEILRAAWKRFREYGVEVPFPQREIRILSDPVA